MSDELSHRYDTTRPTANWNWLRTAGVSARDGLFRYLVNLRDALSLALERLDEHRHANARRFINDYLQHHSTEALRELGYTNAQIAAIRAREYPQRGDV